MQQNMKCHQWLYDCIHQLRLFLAISGGMHSMTYHFIFWQQQWSLTKSWYGVETILPFWHCRDPWWRDQSPGCCKWKSLLLSPPAQRPGDFFYIVYNHWVAQIVGGMSIDLCNDDLDVNFHSFISFTYLGFTKQRNLPTITKQRKRLPRRHQQTTKQRKNLPSRIQQTTKQSEN